MPSIVAVEHVVSPKAPDELPEWATPVVLALQMAKHHGLLDAPGTQWLRAPRQGYLDEDVLPALLGYLASQMSSIKTFCARSQPYRGALAAAAGRRTLPTAASISRYLDAQSLDHVERFTDWLLLDSLPLEAVGCAGSRGQDRLGAALDIFDWDPCILTFRQRGLPQSEEMPAARRRSEEARAGYCGRKRGNVQLSRSLVQHAGSGHWVGLRIHPGNGVAEDFAGHAIGCVQRAAAHAGLDPANCLLRMDGAFGTSTILLACQQAGIGYLTRLSSYAILDLEPIARRMADPAAPWQPVADADSGPGREALELGVVELCEPHRGEAVRVRVVLSRHRADGPRGAGVWRDGWHYELYAVARSSAALDAADVVALYFGRSQMENRLCGLKKEADLDRTFSYHIPGQLQVSALALWWSNLHLLLGARLDPHASAPGAPLEPASPSRESLPDVPVSRPPQPAPTLSDEVDWPAEAAKRKMRWDAEHKQMICQRDRALTIYRRRGSELEFRSRKSDCNGCPFGPTCHGSTARGFRKSVAVRVPLGPGEEPPPPRQPPTWCEESIEPVGTETLIAPALVPSKLRQLVVSCLADVGLRVTLEGETSPPPRDPAAQRQCRRLSYPERRLRNQLHAERVCIEFRPPPHLCDAFERLWSVTGLSG